MNKKRKILTAIAGLTSLTLLGVVAINLNAPNMIFRSNAENNTFTFDSSVGSQYWNDYVTSVKTIKRTSSSDNDMKARVQEGKSFGGDNNFFYSDYMINGKIIHIMIGANNMQSFSFEFKCDYSKYIEPYEIKYHANVKFHGLDYDFLDPDSAAVLFTKNYDSTEMQKNTSYTVSWTKTDEEYTVRHIHIALSIESSFGNHDTYCNLYMKNINVTWSC